MNKSSEENTAELTLTCCRIPRRRDSCQVGMKCFAAAASGHQSLQRDACPSCLPHKPSVPCCSFCAHHNSTDCSLRYQDTYNREKHAETAVIDWLQHHYCFLSFSKHLEEALARGCTDHFIVNNSTRHLIMCTITVILTFPSCEL